MNYRPLMVEDPLPEDMIHCFPAGKVGGQMAPGAATFNQIQDGIQNSAPVNRRAATLGGFGKHGLDKTPLGVVS